MRTRWLSVIIGAVLTVISSGCGGTRSSTTPSATVPQAATAPGSESLTDQTVAASPTSSTPTASATRSSPSAASSGARTFGANYCARFESAVQGLAAGSRFAPQYSNRLVGPFRQSANAQLVRAAPSDSVTDGYSCNWHPGSGYEANVDVGVSIWIWQVSRPVSAQEGAMLWGSGTPVAAVGDWAVTRGGQTIFFDKGPLLVLVTGPGTYHSVLSAASAVAGELS